MNQRDPERVTFPTIRCTILTYVGEAKREVLVEVEAGEGFETAEGSFIACVPVESVYWVDGER